MSGPLTSPHVGCSIERADTSHSHAWDAFVWQHGTAPYHLWAWRGIFEDVFRHPCEYLVARRGSETVGVLPLVKFQSRLFGRLLVSLPFVNYGGIIANDTDAADALLNAACHVAAAERARYVELRHSRRRFPTLPGRAHKVSMRLSLASSVDQMWHQLDRKLRNQVRKAERSNLVFVSGGAELVPEFYEVFAHNMRDLGTPVYPRLLFDHVLDRFAALASVGVVRAGARPVAAAITYRFGDVIEVPWASSLKEYRAECSNVLLYWRTIAGGIETGCREFDFGRSTPGGGTFQFKKQWGAQPTPLHWEYAALQRDVVPDHGPTNGKFGLAIAAWKHLPLGFATRLGPHIVRHIP